MQQLAADGVFAEGITMTERGTTQLYICFPRKSRKLHQVHKHKLSAGDRNFRKHLQGMYAAYINNSIENAGMFQHICNRLSTVLCRISIYSAIQKQESETL
jgi:hypothetical protein